MAKSDVLSKCINMIIDNVTPTIAKRPEWQYSPQFQQPWLQSWDVRVRVGNCRCKEVRCYRLDHQNHPLGDDVEDDGSGDGDDFLNITKFYLLCCFEYRPLSKSKSSNFGVHDIKRRANCLDLTSCRGVYNKSEKARFLLDGVGQGWYHFSLFCGMC